MNATRLSLVLFILAILVATKLTLTPHVRELQAQKNNHEMTYITVIIPNSYRGELYPGMIDDDWAWLKNMLVDGVHVWDLRQCSAGTRVLDYSVKGAWVTMHDSRELRGCNHSSVYAHYELLLGANDILVSVSPNIAFLDVRRFFEFREHVAASKGSLWLGNAVSGEKGVDFSKLFSLRGRTSYVTSSKTLHNAVDGYIFGVKGGMVEALARSVELNDRLLTRGFLGFSAAVAQSMDDLGFPAQIDLGFTVAFSRSPNPGRPLFTPMEDRAGRPSKIVDKAHAPSVFWTVFAGRERYMEMQVPHFNKLLREGVVDEVHFHDFTCKTGNTDDRRWLLAVMRRVSRVFLAFPLDCNWASYYSFYKNHSNADDVILKIDDDIVFVDTSRVLGFINAIRSHGEVFLWSANVVNSGKPAFFQQKDGTLDRAVGPVTWDAESRKKGKGLLYKNSRLGLNIHHYFLNNPKKFTVRREGQPVVHRIQSRISINFIGHLGNYSLMCHDFVLRFGNDEHALTYGATVYQQELVVLYMPLTVAHLAFGHQNIPPDIASWYSRLKVPLSGALQGRDINFSIPKSANT